MEHFSIQLKKRKIIAIIRNIDKGKIINTVRALYDGGIRFVEVTFNQSSPRGNEEAYCLIKKISKEFGDRMFVGAGTVMTAKQSELAIDAGAKYIISPSINEKVIKHTKKLGALSMPGALSPSEIAKAYDEGADYVKVFPAGTFGASYIKAIRSPISHIPLLAVGGINIDNMQEYLDTGIIGVGIGSNMVNRTLINEERYEELTKLASRYTSQIKCIETLENI